MAKDHTTLKNKYGGYRKVKKMIVRTNITTLKFQLLHHRVCVLIGMLSRSNATKAKDGNNNGNQCNFPKDGCATSLFLLFVRVLMTRVEVKRHKANATMTRHIASVFVLQSEKSP